MKDYLVFTLVAPLGSFGDLAGHERRGGASWPGRSAILGLLGAALGVRRDDAAGQEDLRAWKTAVAKLSAGRPLRDFHTVQTIPTAKVKNPDSRREALWRAKGAENTVITRRDYETDCVFVVAIWGGEEIEAAKAALKEPHFTPYLGRKSCPLCAPMAPQIVRASGPAEALSQAQLPPFWKDGSKDAPSANAPLFIVSDEPLEGVHSEESRWDNPGDRVAWHFEPRTVYISRGSQR